MKTGDLSGAGHVRATRCAAAHENSDYLDDRAKPSLKGTRRRRKGLARCRGKDRTPHPLMRPSPLTMEAELAATIPELLDRLA